MRTSLPGAGWEAPIRLPTCRRQSLLVGKAAAEDLATAIQAAIESTDGVDGVRELRTIHIGPDDLVVAAGIWVDGELSAAAISRSIDEAENHVREVSPFRTVVSIEPRVRDAQAPRGDGGGPEPG